MFFMLLPSSSGLTFGLTHLVAASWRTRRWFCGESPPVARFRPIRLLSWRVKWSIELEPSRRQLWSMGGRWPERSENAGSRELDLQINCSTVGERNPTNVTSATMQLAPMHPMWGNTWEHLLQASTLCTMLNMHWLAAKESGVEEIYGHSNRAGSWTVSDQLLLPSNHWRLQRRPKCPSFLPPGAQLSFGIELWNPSCCLLSTLDSGFQDICW